MTIRLIEIYCERHGFTTSKYQGEKKRRNKLEKKNIKDFLNGV